MSTDSSALGFTNQWYSEGVANAIEVISRPVSVKILNLPYFIASKIVAFRGRGENDYMGSRDMEDIISVIEVADEILLEAVMPKVSKGLQKFLKREFQKLLETADFIDCIPGAVFNRTAASEAAVVVKQRMQALIKN